MCIVEAFYSSRNTVDVYFSSESLHPRLYCNPALIGNPCDAKPAQTVTSGLLPDDRQHTCIVPCYPSSIDSISYVVIVENVYLFLNSQEDDSICGSYFGGIETIGVP